jgi:hypothetical protein
MRTTLTASILMVAACSSGPRPAASSSLAPRRVQPALTSEPETVAQAQDAPPRSEYFPVTPFVPEAVKNPDGTVPTEMHPWVFMGALESGISQCSPSTTFSFGSVKDLGIYDSQATQLPCTYDAKQVDEDGLSMAVWGATCTLTDSHGSTFGIRMLGVHIVPHRSESGAWVHDAHYIKGIATTDDDKKCIYRGMVGRR